MMNYQEKLKEFLKSGVKCPGFLKGDSPDKCTHCLWLEEFVRFLQIQPVVKEERVKIGSLPEGDFSMEEIVGALVSKVDEMIKHLNNE